MWIYVSKHDLGLDEVSFWGFSYLLLKATRFSVSGLSKKFKAGTNEETEVLLYLKINVHVPCKRHYGCIYERAL